MFIQYRTDHAPDKIKKQRVQINIEIVIFLVTEGEQGQHFAITNNRAQGGGFNAATMTGE